MTKKVILTGDRPSGKLHLGHYVGSLQNRILGQDKGIQHIMVADIQALTDHAQDPSSISKSIIEVVKDYIAVGLDPNINTIFLQSNITELTEITVYLMNFVTIARLERNPTVKAEIKQKMFNKDIPVGFFCYPISQAADILAFQADEVPVGEDQLPMIELSNEIARKFNNTYNTNCLKECKAIVGKTSRLMGVDGKAKASKSLNNAIYLSDNNETLRQKVFSMYTDPNHIHINDPGSVAGNMVFHYLDAFDPDIDGLKALKSQYQRGGLGDVTIKKHLYHILSTFLTPIREKRLSINDNQVKEILTRGSYTAKKTAQDTLIKIRNAIGLFQL